MRFMFKKENENWMKNKQALKIWVQTEIDTVSSYEQKPMLKN